MHMVMTTATRMRIIITAMITAMRTATITIMTTPKRPTPGVTPMRRSRQELKGPHWLRRGLAAIVAVGLRPCSGAIIVLVFALAQGLFWIGVASTFVMGLGTAITVAIVATIAVGARGFAGRLAKSKPGAGLLIVRGLETAAAAVIILFGVALLTGYMVSERLMGV